MYEFNVRFAAFVVIPKQPLFIIIELFAPDPDTTEKILPEATLTFTRDAFAIVLTVNVDGIVRLFTVAVDAFMFDRLRVEH